MLKLSAPTARSIDQVLDASGLGAADLFEHVQAVPALTSAFTSVASTRKSGGLTFGFLQLG